MRFIPVSQSISQTSRHLVIQSDIQLDRHTSNQSVSQTSRHLVMQSDTQLDSHKSSQSDIQPVGVLPVIPSIADD